MDSEVPGQWVHKQSGARASYKLNIWSPATISGLLNEQDRVLYIDYSNTLGFSPAVNNIFVFICRTFNAFRICQAPGIEISRK